MINLRLAFIRHLRVVFDRNQAIHGIIKRGLFVEFVFAEKLQHGGAVLVSCAQFDILVNRFCEMFNGGFARILQLSVVLLQTDEFLPNKINFIIK